MIERVAVSVLVVDDDPAFRDLASRMLSELGCEEIAEAGDAATAMRQAELKRPQAALVDVGLPDGDGVELARRLAALSWSPRVLLTSSDKDAPHGLGSQDAERGLTFVAKEDLVNGSLAELLSRGS